MSGKLKLFAGIGAGLLIIALIVLYPKISLFLKSRKSTLNTEQVAFFIKTPENARQLAEQLKKEGIIDDVDGFLKVAEYKGIDESNIALGKYLIDKGTQYRTLLNGFKLNAAGNGNAEVEVDVTFNNCRDIYEMAGKVCKNLNIDSIKLVAFLDNDSILEKYGFTRESLPAMFLPNTYKMYFDTDEQLFTERMAEEYNDFWTAERRGKLKNIGLQNPADAVTLASIVYSEQSRNSEEWPVIAGLYLNRLEKGMKLQSDPTFKFCWGDKLEGVQRLLFEHRDIDCPYNTYKINGLPPGPICIPPTAVVDAVLNRDKNDYLFMMAKPDPTGRHDFSTDYSVHQKYAKIYQKWLADGQPQ